MNKERQKWFAGQAVQFRLNADDPHFVDVREDCLRKAEWLEEAAKAPVSVEGWQDIETAPQMKSVLVHYENSLGKSRIVKAVFYPRWTVESDMDAESYDEYSEEKDAYFIREGWYEQIDNWDDYIEVHICNGTPDKWQPLPKPPQTEGNKS